MTEADLLARMDDLRADAARSVKAARANGLYSVNFHTAERNRLNGIAANLNRQRFRAKSIACLRQMAAGHRHVGVIVANAARETGGSIHPKCVRDLTLTGEAVRVSEGVYAITDKGRETLAKDRAHG